MSARDDFAPDSPSPTTEPLVWAAWGGTFLQRVGMVPTHTKERFVMTFHAVLNAARSKLAEDCRWERSIGEVGPTRSDMELSVAVWMSESVDTLHWRCAATEMIGARS